VLTQAGLQLNVAFHFLQLSHSMMMSVMANATKRQLIDGEELPSLSSSCYISQAFRTEAGDRFKSHFRRKMPEDGRILE
jgi:hypothetical protein